MKLLSCLFLFLIVVGVFEKNYVVCGARTRRSNKRGGSVGAIRPMVKAGGAVNPNLGVLQSQEILRLKNEMQKNNDNSHRPAQRQRHRQPSHVKVSPHGTSGRRNRHFGGL